MSKEVFVDISSFPHSHFSNSLTDEIHLYVAMEFLLNVDGSWPVGDESSCFKNFSKKKTSLPKYARFFDSSYNTVQDMCFCFGIIHQHLSLPLWHTS